MRSEGRHSPPVSQQHGPLHGTITDLTEQVHHRGRLNVYLDGCFAFGVSAEIAAAEGLRPGRVLSATDVARLLRADAVQAAREVALRFLSFRPRSEAEVRSYLERRKGYPPDVVMDVLAWLRDRGYIDDTAFAQFWVADRITYRPRGHRLLRAELRRKGVARETVEAALEPLDLRDKALIEQAARMRLRRLAAADKADFQRFRTKIAAFLARRGFDYDDIAAIVRQLWSELQSDGAPLNSSDEEQKASEQDGR
jgi:regulatory protein